MALSPAGPFTAGTVTDVGSNPGVSAWTNPNNAKALDTVTADFIYYQGVTVNFTSNPLQLTNYGFALPSNAIVDGIVVSVVHDGVQVTAQAQLLKAGSSVGVSKSAGPPFASLGTNVLGSATDLWGTTWTGSDINNSGFGVVLNSTETHDPADSSYHVDGASITVYWHAAPAEVPIRHMYAVYNNGVYLGHIPNVTTPFAYSYDINTAGAQITINSGTSADTVIQPNSVILDEGGNPIQDESGNNIGDEGVAPIVELGSGSGGRIIRNGNQVVVTEVSYWNPNGKVVFRGTIQHWEADYGGDSGSDDIMMIIYSDGADLDNHLIKGNPYTYTLDQNQTSQNSNILQSVYGGDKGAGWSNEVAQSFKTGGGVTNIGAITLLVYGTATVTVNLYDSPAMINLLGTVTQYVSVGGATAVQFNFPATVKVTASTGYYFTAICAAGNSLYFYYQNSDVYANGQMYLSSYGGGGGGGWYPNTGNDLYFQTYSGNGSTTATYTSVDPTTGMLEPIMDSYNQEGGVVTYTGSSVTATGLAISYKWNTNTVYEGLQGALSVSPSGYYYTVDLGTDVLTFKQASTTADITLIKGFNIEHMKMIGTIEQIINTVFLTGGLVSGSNIYTLDQDATSKSRYGVHLDRPTNNQILDTTTGHVVGSSEVKSLKNEQYATTVTLAYHKIDFSLIKPGMTVGFSGFGTFVDNLILQIVRLDYTPEELTLTLGIIPKRLHKAVEQTVRGFVGLQTVDNPTAPS